MLSLVTAAELEHHYATAARDRDQQLMLSIREHATAAAEERARAERRSAPRRLSWARPIGVHVDDLACPAA